MKSNKKILVLSRTDEREHYDTQHSMVRELTAVESQNASYHGANLEDLLFNYDGKTLTIVDSKSGLDVSSFDLIFFIGWFKTKLLQDIASAVAHYAKSKNIRFLNTELIGTRSFTKLSQYVLAALNGVSMTPFQFSIDQQLLAQSLQTATFKNQFIAKGISASRGADNYLLTSPEAFEEIINKPQELPVYHIAQEFIPNQGDYRILVMGGKVRLVIHRQSQTDSHLNNTSQGGKASIIPLETLSQDMLEQSVTMAKLLRREVTGVDMIIHQETGKHYLLEANNMPQLSTGSMVQQKMTMLDEYFEEVMLEAEATTT